MPDPLSYWTWSPQLHFPWSGGVTQQIDPEINWFSRWITPGAGNANVEEKAFTDVASYGKQLGLITEILLALVDQTKADQNTVDKLKLIRDRIKDLKKIEETLSNDKIVAQVTAVRERGDRELNELATLLLPLLTKQQQQRAA